MLYRYEFFDFMKNELSNILIKVKLSEIIFTTYNALQVKLFVRIVS